MSKLLEVFFYLIRNDAWSDDCLNTRTKPVTIVIIDGVVAWWYI